MGFDLQARKTPHGDARMINFPVASLPESAERYRKLMRPFIVPGPRRSLRPAEVSKADPLKLCLSASAVLSNPCRVYDVRSFYIPGHVLESLATNPDCCSGAH